MKSNSYIGGGGGGCDGLPRGSGSKSKIGKEKRSIAMHASSLYYIFKRQILAWQTEKQISQPGFEAQQFLYCYEDL